jgi:drug/metabolite transporter (DMT)-like permease
MAYQPTLPLPHCLRLLCRFVGKAEPAIVVALYFHTSTMVLSALPLLIGWPSPAAWLSWSDALLLVGVAATSFAGQLFLTRGFQLLPAGKAAGYNFSQVRKLLQLEGSPA